MIQVNFVSSLFITMLDDFSNQKTSVEIIVFWFLRIDVNSTGCLIFGAD